MRWRPGLGVRTGSGWQSIRRDFAPLDAARLQVGRLDRRRLRGVDRGAGMGQIAGRTATVMRARLAGLIALAGVRGAIVMTDGRPVQRVRRNERGGPAGSDWRENLHRQGEQHNRKEFPQPPAHQQTRPLQRPS